MNQLRGVSPKETLSVAPAGLAFKSRAGNETLLALARTDNFELRLRGAEQAQQSFRVELAGHHERLGAVPISTRVELQKQYLEAFGNLLDTKQAALEAAAQAEWLAGRDAP